MNGPRNFTEGLALLLRRGDLLDLFEQDRWAAVEQLGLDDSTAKLILELHPKEIRLHRNILVRKRMDGCGGRAPDTWARLREGEKTFQTYANAQWPAQGTGGLEDCLAFLEYLQSTEIDALPEPAEFNRLKFLVGNRRFSFRFITGFSTARGPRPALQLLLRGSCGRIYERIFHPLFSSRKGWTKRTHYYTIESTSNFGSRIFMRFNHVQYVCVPLVLIASLLMQCRVNLFSLAFGPTYKEREQRAAATRAAAEKKEELREKAAVEFSRFKNFRKTTTSFNDTDSIYIRVRARHTTFESKPLRRRIFLYRILSPAELAARKAALKKRLARRGSFTSNDLERLKKMPRRERVALILDSIDIELIEGKKINDELGKVVLRILPPPPEADHAQYYKLLEGLGKLKDGTYDLKVEAYNMRRGEGAGTFKLTIDRARLLKRWRSYKDAYFAKNPVKLTVEKTDPALASAIKKVAEKRFNAPVVKVAITDADWSLIRHKRTGLIKWRYIRADTVLFRKDEPFRHCVKVRDRYYQRYVGGSFESTLKPSDTHLYYLKQAYKDVPCSLVGIVPPGSSGTVAARTGPGTGKPQPPPTRSTSAKKSAAENPAVGPAKKTEPKAAARVMVKKAPPKKLPPPGPEAVVIGGKIWQKCPRGSTYGGGTCTGRPRKADFEAARAYCETLTLSGRNWRLPTAGELESLLKKDTAGAKIDGTRFPGTAADAHWTADIYEGQAVYVVDFYLGLKYPYGPRNTAHVRCIAVR